MAELRNCRYVVFGAFGTLFDTSAAAPVLERAYPGYGMELSRRWEEKQLQHAWVLTMTGGYADYETISVLALAAACRRLGLEPGPAEQNYLSTVSRTLPPFPDVQAGLAALHQTGLGLAILSNGTLWQLQSLVRHGGLAGPVQLLSVDAIGKYKPHPASYALIRERLAVSSHEVLYVSAHEWDIVGAAAAGLPTAWLNRTGDPPEGLGANPSGVVYSLQELVYQLRAALVM